MIGSPRKVSDSFPIDFVEIQANPNPTSRTNIRRHEKSLCIVSDQAALLAEARLAAKRDHTVAVMIEEIIREILFANSKDDVPVADCFVRDFRQSLAYLNQPLTTVF